MQVLDYPSAAAAKRLARIRGRAFDYSGKDLRAVSRILEDVRRRGDEALADYTRRFDAPSFAVEDLRVGPQEFRRAAAQASRGFRRALDRAASQIEAFHRRQLGSSHFSFDRPGTLLGQIVHPVDRAGVYVPGGMGGSTPLVSSVLMGAIPARVAGVGRIVMVSPPTAEGRIDPHLLLAARKAGIDEVYKVGSAWAVGALAFGTETIPKVDVVVGPGNIFVTLAKKVVAGTVGIDLIAGPSEILVVADDSGDAEFIAADLLSQAEHDPMASAVLITTHRALAAGVGRALKRQIAPLARAETARRSLARYGALLVVSDVAAALELSNEIAPEHLELHLREPFAHLGSVRNAGAVFLGPFTPEPVGDYVAGPNHVLPTAGTARFASALSVEHFLKRTSVIQYSRQALQREGRDIIALAEVEGLGAHANAVRKRLERPAPKPGAAKGRGADPTGRLEG